MCRQLTYRPNAMSSINVLTKRYMLSINVLTKRYMSSINILTKRHMSSINVLTKRYMSSINISTKRYVSSINVLTKRYMSSINVLTKRYMRRVARFSPLWSFFDIFTFFSYNDSVIFSLSNNTYISVVNWLKLLRFLILITYFNKIKRAFDVDVTYIFS